MANFILKIRYILLFLNYIKIILFLIAIKMIVSFNNNLKFYLIMQLFVWYFLNIIEKL